MASTVSSTESPSDAPSSYNPRYIDIGINLTDPMFSGVYHDKVHHESDLDDIIERAKQSGLEKLVVTGSDLEHSRQAIELAAKYPGYIYTTVGLHPCSAKQLVEKSTPEEYLAELKELTKSPHVAAFGEFGLDYDRLHYATVEEQKLAFDLQLDLAESLDLPLFLHSRAAADDFEAALRPRLQAGKLKGGVVHSFTGTVEEMKRLVDLGLYIGINGCSLKTKENLDVVKEVPLDKLMLESDGPWCEIRPSHESSKVLKEAEKVLGGEYVKVLGAPAVKKEKFVKGRMVKSRNEPSATALVAVVVAMVKGVGLEEVCEAAWRNSVRLFGLGEKVDDVVKN